MYTKEKIARSGFGAFTLMAALVTVGVGQARSQSAESASCPSTAIKGCNITGITQPNNLDICPGTGTNVHNSATADDQTSNLQLWTTQLCNTQPIDPATWVYGPSNDATLAQQAAPFWNKVMVSMSKGLPIKGTRWADPYGSDYCATAAYAPGSNDFNWADQMHSSLDNSEIWTAWGTITGSIPEPTNVSVATEGAPTNCGLTPSTIAERGEFASSLDEREAQHGADGGGDVFLRPVTSVRDAQEAIFWTFWPPFGHRSQGFSTAQYNSLITANGNAPYRASYNSNIVMMAVIQTVQGAQNANGIAALDGIDALVIDDQDLKLQGGGDLVGQIEGAAQKNQKYLCHLDWSAKPATISCTSPTQRFGMYWPNRRLDGNGMPAGSPTTTASLGKE